MKLWEAELDLHLQLFITSSSSLVFLLLSCSVEAAEGFFTAAAVDPELCWFPL